MSFENRSYSSSSDVFGGVRCYIEPGNVFLLRGHTFTIYTPGGTLPTWLEFSGRVEKLDCIAESRQEEE